MGRSTRPSVTTILFGRVPPLQATRSNLQDCLREGGREGSGGRGRAAFRNALVVGQFALSLILLAGAGLMLRTFAALIGTQTGMSAEHVLTMRIPFPLGSPKYRTPDDALNRFYNPVLARVRSLPGVRNAGLINLLPLQASGNNGNFQIVGKSYATISDQPFAEVRVVSPGYFSTGIPVERGRDVAESDRATTQQVVMVNAELAKRFFPGEDPIGKQIQFGAVSPTNPPNLIAIAGIYGVMSYGVTQRTREFGIRLALGSDIRRVQGLVVWQGTRLALVGLAIGISSAFLLTKFLSGVLYGVAPGDPLTAASCFRAPWLGQCVMASYLPSRRVTSVDPIIAMRAE